jgi:hypothetical protein
MGYTQSRKTKVEIMRHARGIFVVVFLAAGAPRSMAQTQAATGDTTMQAIGTFDVQLTPQPSESAGVPGRMSIAKVFHGDLEGTSQGQMLTAMTRVDGSAAYVAIEEFGGTLHGRSGTFALHHSGTMTRGAQELSVRVVPDSGSGELVGLAGSMTIEIAADGVHSYTLEYTLPESP